MAGSRQHARSPGRQCSGRHTVSGAGPRCDTPALSRAAPARIHLRRGTDSRGRSRGGSKIERRQRPHTFEAAGQRIDRLARSICCSIDSNAAVPVASHRKRWLARWHRRERHPLRVIRWLRRDFVHVRTCIADPLNPRAAALAQQCNGTALPADRCDDRSVRVSRRTAIMQRRAALRLSRTAPSRRRTFGIWHE